MNIHSFSSYKIVVVGSSGVGKTAIVKRLIDDVFTGENETTIGVEFKSFPCKCGEDWVKLDIWDTAGQEKFRAISKAYFRNSVGAVLVFSLTDKNSFDSLSQWISDLQTLSSPNCVILLIGNKSDLDNQRCISQSDIDTFSNRYSIDYIETSALTSKNISESFLRLSNLIHSKVKIGEISGSFQKLSKPSINITNNNQNQKNNCC